MRSNVKNEKYILSKLQLDEITGCWNSKLTLSKTRNLCMVKIDGIQRPLHRVVWELCKGDIPVGLQVLHVCDNRKCCNPDHLKLGKVKRGKSSNKKVRKTKEYIKSVSRVNELTDCWESIYKPNRNGYCRVRVDGEAYSLHRLAWEIWNGPILDLEDSHHGICVMHKCDNRICINPSHLILGTHQDNMADRNNKNRQSTTRGENNVTAKVTTSQVLQLRQMYASGKYTTRQLAVSFNLAKATVSGIIQRRSWKHI